MCNLYAEGGTSVFFVWLGKGKAGFGEGSEMSAVPEGEWVPKVRSGQ